MYELDKQLCINFMLENFDKNNAFAHQFRCISNALTLRAHALDALKSHWVCIFLNSLTKIDTQLLVLAKRHTEAICVQKYTQPFSLPMDYA